MVIMEAYYNHEKLQGIWKTIDKLHLSYLEIEESPEKLEHRNKLEDCIRDFLCMAAHNEKFSYGQTAEVLFRSASSKKDFSGYKAATGWNALQLYAGNLLSQPWRKEYRVVKTYCGFYKHQIEANLVGAEIMFEAMGYKHFGDGVLVLEGPICPDTVTNVSKDCLIAYVECQILKMIWEEVSPNFNINWLDILEFRQSHICSPEHSIRALNYQHQQRQYHQEQNHSYPPPDMYITRPQQNNSHSNQNHSFPPLSNHLPVVDNHAHYMYTPSRCCVNNFSTYAPSYYPVPYPPPAPPPPPPPATSVIKPPLITNGYYCTNGYLPQNVYGYAVPTGQLIELDHHHHINTPNNYDVVDSRPQTKIVVRQNDKIRIVEDKNGKEQFENWDYVYRNLESQGYSKDLGERGDILKQSQRKSKSTNLDEAFTNLGLDEKPIKQKKAKSANLDEGANNYLSEDRPLKISEALIRYDDSKETTKLEPRQASVSSSYENLSLEKKKKTKSSTKETSTSKKVDVKKVKTNKWQCKHCTYLNEGVKDICEICGKSKVTVAEPEMEIGGAECSQCTLVNPRELKKCRACDSSLKDSPTYI